MGGGVLSGQKSGYLSYLLRLWQEDSGELPCSRDEASLGRTEDEVVWRASLESSLTGKVQGFASLDGLFAFLKRRTVVVPKATSDGGAMRARLSAERGPPSESE